MKTRRPKLGFQMLYIYMARLNKLFKSRQILLSNSISNKPWLLPRSPQLILPSPIKFLQIKPYSSSIKCKRITEHKVFILGLCFLPLPHSLSRVPSNLTLLFAAAMVPLLPPSPPLARSRHTSSPDKRGTRVGTKTPMESGNKILSTCNSN